MAGVAGACSPPMSLCDARRPNKAAVTAGSASNVTYPAGVAVVGRVYWNAALLLAVLGEKHHGYEKTPPRYGANCLVIMYAPEYGRQQRTHTNEWHFAAIFDLRGMRWMGLCWM